MISWNKSRYLAHLSFAESSRTNRKIKLSGSLLYIFDEFELLSPYYLDEPWQWHLSLLTYPSEEVSISAIMPLGHSIGSPGNTFWYNARAFFHSSSSQKPSELEKCELSRDGSI